ncbi:YcaO-like family protein [Amycolatopsis sp. FBCC-B4732]|uniref:YcaO-like family protein n=1 Tax=Amycolatopsis sp. FBCC-B4732 TaxID=3079339 RepID=UPI001FF6315B|nr:YcaO-like family protein [Amycolatopsis sp. FBCC-B4732]UOX89544.1 YcaO-like family protein [Amycolatopsis sp. FBCC-B4732]
MTALHEGLPGRSGERRSAPGSGPIVTRLRSFAGLAGTPAALHLAVADIRDVRAELPWQGDLQGFGTSWDDPAHARVSARGEAVERYCATRPPRDVVHGSHDDLVARGLTALSPGRLALYSPRQYATPGFPFTPFLPSSPVHWVRATSLGGGDVHVPAFLVHTGWPHVPKASEEPLHAFPAIGGTAAGETLEAAIRSGLQEIVEHDASAVWWLNGAPQPTLAPTPRLASLAGADEVRFWSIANAFGVPVLAAAVRSPEGWLTVGTATRPDPEQAALKALAEAYTLQITCRTLDDRDALSAIIAGYGGRPGPLRPWRAERDYADHYGPADLVELLCHQQFHLDPRAGAAALAWATGGPPLDWAAIPRPADDSLDALLACVAAAGHEVLYVDLTTPEAAADGVRVVRVLVPGTVGTAPAAYPPLGLRRVQDLGVRLGWHPEPLDEEQLNRDPMPHG